MQGALQFAGDGCGMISTGSASCVPAVSQMREQRIMADTGVANQGSIEPLEAIVGETVQRYGMFTPGQTVIVAISGGPDSTALLHLLASLRAEWALTVIAAHLNHGFRGAESEGDATFVAELCRSLAVPCALETADVPAAAQRRHLSAQEAAREVRHAFLRRTAAHYSATCIAVGHTRDDRVETILLNLLRGTGPEGLAGFTAHAPPLVRPLYNATRAQVIDYCRRHRLQPRQDSSNAKTDYLRNRTRAELLPYLRSYYNEKADLALLRAAELIFADNEVLEEMAGRILAEEGRFIADNEVTLLRELLMALPIALQRRALRQAIARVRGHLQGVTYELIQGALTALADSRRFSVTLPATEIGSATLVCNADGVTVRLLRPPSSPTPWETPLLVPGSTRLDRAGLCVRADLCADGFELESLLNAAQLRDSVAYGNMHVAVFPLAEVALPLTARSWRPGDRIRLRREGGGKKLQDLFVDRKIPAQQRSQQVVIAAADDAILAVLGVAMSATAIPATRWFDLHGEAGRQALLALTPCRLSAGERDPTESLPS
jgi:tRNA(Ile)-lysidine synthase